MTRDRLITSVSTSSTCTTGRKVIIAVSSCTNEWSSKGFYPYKELPAVLGKETAGTIVALPTDPEVLNNETYKKNGFKVGGKVAVVSVLLCSPSTDLDRPTSRIPLDHTQHTSRFLGKSLILFRQLSRRALRLQRSSKASRPSRSSRKRTRSRRVTRSSCTQLRVGWASCSPNSERL